MRTDLTTWVLAASAVLYAVAAMKPLRRVFRARSWRALRSRIGLLLLTALTFIPIIIAGVTALVTCVLGIRRWIFHGVSDGFSLCYAVGTSCATYLAPVATGAPGLLKVQRLALLLPFWQVAAAISIVCLAVYALLISVFAERRQ